MASRQRLPHLLGSKWTAQQPTEGWRHFQVLNRKQQGNWIFAELVAACDPSVRLWVNARQLKNPQLWQAGWQSLQQSPAQLHREDP
ncbi:MAG: TIGR02450 family Trp-rich protein [Cyanobacteria bacterium REEB459]|nr:TIGR02450 family Trp-rich protein [Cyanobacteria bacterium REEB459]